MGRPLATSSNERWVERWSSIQAGHVKEERWPFKICKAGEYSPTKAMIREEAGPTHWPRRSSNFTLHSSKAAASSPDSQRPTPPGGPPDAQGQGACFVVGCVGARGQTCVREQVRALYHKKRCWVLSCN